jgi:anthranilate phosphoribosyltransferase
MTLQEAIRNLIDGESLTEREAYSVASGIMDGEATPSQIAAVLVALRIKGESVSEITGFARAMRDRAQRVPIAADGLIDTCGTGGDGTGTFNISTVCAIVAAAAGCKVAKHGNRSVSSRCGSVEFLEALGVRTDTTPDEASRLIERVGVAFLFAPQYHQATRHASAPRREIGVRSIFNIVGPLTNPARARRQLVGVFDPALTEPMAEVLRNLGSEHCLVVHGEDGLDEISLTSPTRVTELKDGDVDTRTITPEEFGLSRAPLATIKGSDPATNAEIALEVLRGKKGPPRDVVLLNSAAAVYVGGLTGDIASGVEAAVNAIDSGRAMAILEALREGDGQGDG